MPGAVFDRELTALVDSALANVGVYVFNAIKDPAMPRWMLGAIDRAKDEVWDDVETERRRSGPCVNISVYDSTSDGSCADATPARE